MLLRVSVNDAFMHYLQNMSSPYGALPQTVDGAPPLSPAEGFPSLRPLICPTLHNNPAGAHDFNPLTPTHIIF